MGSKYFRFKRLVVTLMAAVIVIGITTLVFADSTIEKIDSVFSTARSLRGDPSGVAFENGDTLYSSFKNDKVVKIYNDSRDELKNIASGAFSDLAGHWSADYVSMPVYYGVLNGYEDGTLRPENNVSAGEVAKVVATAYEGEMCSGGSLTNAEFGESWYNNYYRYCAKVFTYKESTAMTPQYMESAMKRCEVAYVMAKACDDGTLDSYIAKAEAGDISSMSAYWDFNNVTASDSTLANEQWHMSEGRIPARFAGAMMYLKDKGIMIGDTAAGTISPLAGVKRGEVFKLIQETCKATKSYKQGQFKGNEKVIVRGSTTKPSTNKGTTVRPDGTINWSYEESGQWSEDYEYWQTRPNITVRWDETSRGRLKVGDTFIAQDGTSYYLDHTGIFGTDGKTEVVGVGLPIALDLGRTYFALGDTSVVTDGYQADIKSFGWVTSDTSTAGQKYIIFDETGEGHWRAEWEAIRKYTEPQEAGVHGQISEDGYWKYNANYESWTFRIRL